MRHATLPGRERERGHVKRACAGAVQPGLGVELAVGVRLFGGRACAGIGVVSWR